MVGVSVVCNFTGVIIHDFWIGLDDFCLSITGELLALTFHLKGDLFFSIPIKQEKIYNYIMFIYINIRLKFKLYFHQNLK